MKSTGLKLTFAAAMLASVAMPALADDAAPSWGSLSAYVAVTTDYRFRGISQNDRQPSEQGSINWTGPLGFYAGTWVAKVNWSGEATNFNQNATPTFEADFYAGKHFDLDGTDLNVEAYYYSYPDANKNVLGTYSSYYETIVQLTHTFDKLTVTATGANSPEWSLKGGTSWYGAGTASYAITDWLSVSGTFGHQYVQRAPADYDHWDIGATATYKSFVLDVRYVGNDIKKSDAAFWMSSAGLPPLGNTHAIADGVFATLTFNISDLLK